MKIKKQTNEQTTNNKAAKIIYNIFVVVCEKSNFSERTISVELMSMCEFIYLSCPLMF